MLRQTPRVWSASAAVARLVLAALALALLATPPAGAQEAAPRLSFPLDCVPGTTCFVQNYVDRDPGTGARDFRCGRLTYDGHDGTDIRLPHLAAMRRGVAVLAAAAGVVLAIRDGTADLTAGQRPSAAKMGRECGNGVRIGHGAGWQSVYCHMRKGSVAVRPGDQVAAGTRLGLIGMSGRTEFPHLHLAIRFHDEPVDPFVGRTSRSRCGFSATALWTAAAEAALPYRPSALLGAGFAATAPTKVTLLDGQHRAHVLPRSASALIFWVQLIGLHPGDEEAYRVVAPDGRVLTNRRFVRRQTHKALWHSFIGERRRGEAWPNGTYRASYTLSREIAGQRQVVIEAVREVEIR